MPIEPFAGTIQTLKTAVHKMLLERSELLKQSETAEPSPVWSEMLSVFRYLMNLSVEDFKHIRYHTELITGDLIGTYWAPYPPLIPEDFANSLGYLDLFQHLPEAYWIGEPPIPGIPKPFGVNYKGLILNRNIARYQITIANLYYAGIVQSLQASAQPHFIMEIGGGYGGLAHHLSRLLGAQTTYLLVDLPEMFMFQVPYLAINNPDKSIYIYDRETFTPEFIHQTLPTFDFAVIPNYALQKLEVIQDIPLLINMQSFQEMSESQVREYLEFGAQRVTQFFYSDNVDRFPYNTQLVSVSTLLEQYFNLYPSTQYYDTLFKQTDWRWSRYYKKFLATPKGKQPISNVEIITKHHADDAGKLERFSPPIIKA